MGSGDSADGEQQQQPSHHGDVVTTTHTISEMHVRERNKRGRSEKRVVVKMAMHHRQDGGGSDGDDGGRDGADERNTNGSSLYNARSGKREIAVEEIDGNEDTSADVRTRLAVAAANGAADSGSTSSGKLLTAEVDDATIQQAMHQLVADTERMKQYFHDQEQEFRRESEYVEHLKREHKALKTMAKEYKCRAREQKRVQRILREAKKESKRASNSSGGSSSSRAKKRLKKQCRRLQQFQSELALRLEVVQSKNSVYEMHVEKQLADLRREYSDNYLFPNAFPFQ